MKSRWGRPTKRGSTKQPHETHVMQHLNEIKEAKRWPGKRLAALLVLSLLERMAGVELVLANKLNKVALT